MGARRFRLREGGWKGLVLIGSDVLAILGGIVLALALRFEGRIPASEILDRRLSLSLGVLLYVACLQYFKLYARAWRFASLDTLSSVVKATLLGTGGVVLAQIILDGRTFPRSVIVLTWLNTLLLIGAIRIALRLLSQRLQAAQRAKASGMRRPAQRKRILIAGAGDAGATLLSKINARPELGYEPVGFIDDDSSKHGLMVYGSTVLGSRADLPFLLSDLDVDEVIIAIPSASGQVIREIVRACEDAAVAVKTVPSFLEMVNGKFDTRQIRDVQVEDLLRRVPVVVNVEEISGYIRERRVLITGAGGSIGSELCRQVMGFGPEQLILVDHEENSIFEMDTELRARPSVVDIVPAVGDIRDEGRMERVFRAHHPHIIFHAAAYKHVPLMETHPVEAIHTNLFGTATVAECACRHGAERFIFISTDKAVNPTNLMGASKRAAELWLHFKNHNCITRLIAVRFGNVLASRGSCVPIFRRQIERGGPLTVTHPEVTRYFMTIPEAVQLVIQAGAMGKGGEIFMLNMGEPVRILDLAVDLITLSGYEPYRDIPIVFTGLRPGEKLTEQLFADNEPVAPTTHKDIFVVQPSAPYSAEEFNLRLGRISNELSKNGECNTLRFRQLIAALVPNYLPGDPNGKLGD